MKVQASEPPAVGEGVALGRGKRRLGPAPKVEPRSVGTLTLVRHGQASLGAENYDCLSDLGRAQGVRLGEYWRERGLRFNAVITGTLQRHRQTWDAIAQGLGIDEPASVSCPGLDEYDSSAVIAAAHGVAPDPPDSSQRARAYFRLLREGLAAWMHGRTAPLGMPSYVDFLAGVTDALEHVRHRHPGGDVLIVTSGGPISAAIGHVLGTPPATTIELNLQIRNTSTTEFRFTSKGFRLMTFNGLPHLDRPGYESWTTYA